MAPPKAAVAPTRPDAVVVPAGVPANPRDMAIVCPVLGSLISEGKVKMDADGNVKMNAKLDFPPKKADLDFDVSAKGLDITKLPKSWNLPPQFTAGKALGAAKVRVVIEFHDKDRVWSTVGVSTNIIEASWKALVDAYEYKLLRGSNAA